VRVDVVTDLVIDRPCDVVAAYAADPDTAPVWYANITSVEWRTGPPLAPGSRLAFVAHFLGRRIAYTYEVAEFVPGRRLVMRTSEAPMPMETTYTWESTGNGATRMTLHNRGEPRGFAAVTRPFMTAAIRRANRKDLARLKTILEAQPGQA
jgi:Polyketide cyclase / dehydrase and lipid transport